MYTFTYASTYPPLIHSFTHIILFLLFFLSHLQSTRYLILSGLLNKRTMSTNHQVRKCKNHVANNQRIPDPKKSNYPHASPIASKNIDQSERSKNNISVLEDYVDNLDPGSQNLDVFISDLIHISFLFFNSLPITYPLPITIAPSVCPFIHLG